MKSDKKELVFWCIFILMAAYYGYRLFALTPWYDELYTYYCFISRGPVYAAIHWPLPNNHVGYSVLSACLDKIGNSYIGLRGVSYVAALFNIRLIYVIARRTITGWISIGTVLLYISMNLVNQMAVQGRGYTLGISCLLSALYCMTLICEKKVPSKWAFIGFVCSIVLGLYAVSSHVYWVVPLCLAGGIYLLTESITDGKESQNFFLKTPKGKRLLQLVLASVIAAIITIGLYATIWLAIGSNLLVKDSGSVFFGMSHVDMILKSPFTAIGRGMEYMLDTPYIQSEERTGFASRLIEFLITLSGQFFNGLSILIMGIWIAGIAFIILRLIKSRKDTNYADRLLHLLLLVNILFIPICLLIQCKRPYYRVFTYVGVLLALLAAVLLNSLWKQICSKLKKPRYVRMATVISSILFVVFGLKCLFFSGYNEQYSFREYEIQEALEHGDVINREQLCVTDCNQQYLLYFLYGIRCENQQIEDSDLVLLDKRMTNEDFDEMIWEFYHYYHTIPWDYMEQQLQPIYENRDYILYTNKK